MMLKEIKPGMAIHYKTQEEYKRLDEEVRNLGFGTLPNLGFNEESFDSDYVYVITDDCVFWNTAACREYIEFSDLIIPELTAKEVFSIISEIHKESYKKCNGCIGCPISEVAQNCDTDRFAKNADKIIEICQQWKSDHDKKEPEIETVDICRIIEIQPNGFKRCVHEEDIDSGLPFGGDEQQKVEEILKHYCMEHDGNFIAVHEIVSRVRK